MPAAVFDLTTVARLKSHLGIQTTDTTADTVLQIYITSISKWFETRCRRVFRVMPYSDRFDGNGFTHYTLEESPVQSVVAVTINGLVIPLQPAVDQAGYVQDYNRIELHTYRFDPGVVNCQIDYTAGFPTTPEDLEQACFMMIADIYRARGREGLSSRSVASGESVSFRPDTIPLFVELTLSLYQKVLV